MKLDEITRPHDRGEAARLLFRAGYDQIGDGAFAEVFAKPGSPYVLKLFSDTDLAYRSYIDLVKKNSNIHFPHVRGPIIDVADGYCAVRLEKLDPYTGDEKFLEEICQYIDIKSQENNMTNTSSLEKKIGKDIQNACDLIAEIRVPTKIGSSKILDGRIVIARTEIL